jgi:hypothetical protein
MKRPSKNVIAIGCVAFCACFAFSTGAQELWKYTDKNGKVTYSDSAPKEGEKAERVSADTTGTVIPASKNLYEGKPQGSAAVSSRASEREAERDAYRKKLESARAELDQARKALETGRDPSEEERQILVGRGKDGKPTGVNAVNRKPEYYERVAGLEAAIKKAEEKVAAAEKEFREKAPQ